jgi:hypothetical protein
MLAAGAFSEELLTDSYPPAESAIAGIAASAPTAGVVPQQPLSLSPSETTSAAPVIADPATLPPAIVGDSMGVDPYHGMPTAAPVSWISGPYFKAGVLSGVNGGLFKGMGQGYTISGGYRQPLGPEVAGDRVFFDLGGSYQSVFGHNEQFIPQNFIHTPLPAGIGPVIVDRLETSRVANLREVRQAAMNVAVGWYWGPPVDNRAADPQLRFATRLGGRLGHARGHFLEQQLPVTLVNNNFQSEVLVQIPYERKDTFGGLFIGQEAILLNRDIAIGHVQWTADVQYTNDWLEFGGGTWKGSVGTLAITSGFMLSW